MVIDFPAEILAERLVDGRGRLREIHRDVVLKALGADIVEKFLHARDLDNAIAAEGLQLTSCLILLRKRKKRALLIHLIKKLWLRQKDWM